MCAVADIHTMFRNRTKDIGGGREASRKELMEHERHIFPVVNCVFWLVP